MIVLIRLFSQFPALWPVLVHKRKPIGLYPSQSKHMESTRPGWYVPFLGEPELDNISTNSCHEVAIMWLRHGCRGGSWLPGKTPALKGVANKLPWSAGCWVTRWVAWKGGCCVKGWCSCRRLWTGKTWEGVRELLQHPVLGIVVAALVVAALVVAAVVLAALALAFHLYFT